MIILDWIIQNLSTILIALGVFFLCLAIVRKMIRDKKKGKSSCSCGCSGCAMKDMCHTQNAPRPKQSDEAQKEQKS